LSEATPLKPHDLAAAEINGWRGRCLDLYARGERSVDHSLELASRCDGIPAMKPLAGQRLAEVLRLAVEEPGTTEKQSTGLLLALERWSGINAQRAYLAHGVATVLLDRQGAWHAQFDFVRYQGKRREPQRWALSKNEALQFEAELEQAFMVLSAQLGHFRKRRSI
jgi:N-acetylglutamate synthase-like GNAT family acetyltransferase